MLLLLVVLRLSRTVLVINNLPASAAVNDESELIGQCREATMLSFHHFQTYHQGQCSVCLVSVQDNMRRTREKRGFVSLKKREREKEREKCLRRRVTDVLLFNS